MDGNSHVKAEHYELTRGGRLAAGRLARLVHQHVLEGCPVCRQEWERLVSRQPEIRRMLSELAQATGDGAATSPPNYDSAFGVAAKRVEAEARQLKEDRRRARRELRRLLAVAPERWSEKVYSARRSYRSRAFAELLVEEARRRVRERPRLARQLAELVAEVLHWIPGAESKEWAAELTALARGQVGNALRVEGELPEADRRFAELRRDLQAAPVDDAEVLAELSSLEASLRIDQRRFDEAAELLGRAALLYRRAGLAAGQARVLIQRAGLDHQAGDDPAAEAALAQARELLSSTADPLLRAHAVGAHVLSLCNLERYDEAAAVLDAEVAVFEAIEDPWTALLLRGLRGRIAFGRGDLGAAREAFTSVRDGALLLDRGYDAALASLDLALVALEGGRDAELRTIAAGLVAAFEARDVGREALAALALFQRAAAAGELTASLVARVRRRFEEAGSRRRQAADSP